MEYENLPHMRRWNLDGTDYGIVLTGTVYGHAQLADGREITTSPLMQVRLQDQILLVQTHNTCYLCPLSEVDPSCQLTKKYLLSELPEASLVLDQWLNADPFRPVPDFAHREIPVPEDSYLLVLDTGRPYLFYGLFCKEPQGYRWVQRRGEIKLGMFSDSVFCTSRCPQSNKTLVDLRYLPKQGGYMMDTLVYPHLRFYRLATARPDTQVFVLNIGEEPFQLDEVEGILGKTILNSWQYIRLPLENSPQWKECQEMDMEMTGRLPNFGDLPLEQPAPPPSPAPQPMHKIEILQDLPLQFPTESSQYEVPTPPPLVAPTPALPIEEDSLFTERDQSDFSGDDTAPIPELKFEEVEQIAQGTVQELKLDLKPNPEKKDG